MGPGYEHDWSSATENSDGEIPPNVPSFATLLSIFFPAVTDPLAGSNLSGDLRDPQGSIPIGTILAVCVTTLVFSLQVLFVGGSCERWALIGNGPNFPDRLIVTRLGCGK